MKKKYVFIQTIGCQMNVYDADQMARYMGAVGYEKTEHIEAADVILLNTCSVREKAEQKAFSFLGRLSDLKGKKPGLVIGVGGCVAQQEGDKILRRVPHVDLVFGTRTIHRLPRMIQKITEKRCRLVDLELAENYDMTAPEKTGAQERHPSRFVTIMRGCDNYCAYCVVPFVRGRETSRAPENILAEITSLVSAGVREVTLLGQNVNSYGIKEGLCTFPELLAQVNEIQGLERIRFTTSHPKDLSIALMSAFGRLEKLCRHIHLPVQSGSSRILKKMNRRYTREIYLEKIVGLRSVCPDIAVSSDFIVGFPGETADDFNETLDLIRAVQFDSVFAFIYSDRPHAPAVYFEGKVPESEKKERLQELLAVQGRITEGKNRAMVGRTVSVLVEGLSKQQDMIGEGLGVLVPQWSGRTPDHKIVNFTVEDKAGGPDWTGKLVDIRIEKALAHSLWGRPVGSNRLMADKKGANSYAA